MCDMKTTLYIGLIRFLFQGVFWRSWRAPSTLGAVPSQRHLPSDLFLFCAAHRYSTVLPRFTRFPDFIKGIGKFL